jgi:hypothetical protein
LRTVDQRHVVVGEQLSQLARSGPPARLHEVGQLGGEGAAALDGEITDDVVRTDAGQPQCSQLLLAGIGDQSHRLADCDDHARRFGEAAVESDVDRTVQMTRCEASTLLASITRTPVFRAVRRLFALNERTLRVWSSRG